MFHFSIDKVRVPIHCSLNKGTIVLKEGRRQSGRRLDAARSALRFHKTLCYIITQTTQDKIKA